MFYLEVSNCIYLYIFDVSAWTLGKINKKRIKIFSCILIVTSKDLIVFNIYLLFLIENKLNFQYLLRFINYLISHSSMVTMSFLCKV